MSKAKPFRLVVNRPSKRKAVAGVYLVTDGGELLVERVSKAMRGGVEVLQYREKIKCHAERFAEASALRKICADSGVTFIVNDDVQLAFDVKADGVHLGQEDGTITMAREKLGADALIGKSTHNLQEALQAQQDGADYIGFGAVYPTCSKEVLHIPGVKALQNVCGAVQIPVAAIGGINNGNASAVLDAGAAAVAVMSSVLSSRNSAVAVAELRLLFNRSNPLPRGAVLSVAGSDSGGGAGVQADIKTITLLGSYAASAITALTAQNTRGVKSIHGLPPSFVCDQIDTVLSDIPVNVIKTGMLHTPAIIEAIAEKLAERHITIPMVIDPVMVAKGGAALLEREAVQVFCELLIPMAFLLTPNVPEAERLLGRTIISENDMERAARDLYDMGAANVLVKGGHLDSRFATDILYDGEKIHRFSSERVFTNNTHGTGCSYASAIAAMLAQGMPLVAAVALSKEFITLAIRNARTLGRGHSPVNHFMAARDLPK